MIKEFFDSLRDSLDEYFSRDENKIIEDLKVKIRTCKNEISALTKIIDSQLIVIKQLQDDLKNCSCKPSALEVELNSKIPKIKRFYSRYETDGQYSIDVRNYFQKYDDKIPVVTGKNYDEIAFNAYKKTRELVKYVSDKTSYGFGEYWAYGYQTLNNGVGDCEDGAILMANIMLKSGIPYYRIRLNAGSVNGGGHAYVTYCRETDNEFVVLDWCYWPNNKLVKDRKTHKEERNYMNEEKNFYVWFSWNEKFVFGKEQITEGFLSG